MFASGRVDVADHLQRLSLADIFVDTPQYNGGTTGTRVTISLARTGTGTAPSEADMRVRTGRYSDVLTYSHRILVVP
jgi:hypothetical protein